MLHFKAQNFFTITMIYVLCYGLTSFFVTPIQKTFLSEATVFASLIYLPHGVRVLATMFYGWKAIAPIILGNILAGFFFAPQAVLERELLPWLLPIIVASCSSYMAFELFRFFGKDYYAKVDANLNWTQILSVGFTASIINSIGQSIILGSMFNLVENPFVFLIFTIGDTMGLLVSLFVLMLVFRWIRQHAGGTN